MGNADTKLNFRKAVVQLTSKTEVKFTKTCTLILNFVIVTVLMMQRLFQPIDAGDESFWEQFWSESVTSVQDVFTLVPGAEIRALREESPTNLATLVYKAVEKLVKLVDSSCRSQKDQQAGMLIYKLGKCMSDSHTECSIHVTKIVQNKINIYTNNLYKDLH